MVLRVDIVKAIQEYGRQLAKISILDDFYRQAVEGSISLFGFDRAELLLYEEDSHEVIGTWGSHTDGSLVSQTDQRGFLSGDFSTLGQTLSQTERTLCWEDAESRSWSGVVGRGGKMIVVLADSDRVFGWLCADNALSHNTLTHLQRDGFPLYAQEVCSTLQRRLYNQVLSRYRAQNELKDRLFTILAHDLRGPIGNLASLLGMLCDHPVDRQSLDESLSEGRQAALRTYNLLENVLGWVRGQLDEISALRERIPLIRPLTAVQNWLDSSAKSKSVELVLDCHPSLTVYTDERMVETIVRNLVSNAIKYSPMAGKIILRGRNERAMVCIEVVDYGIGIPADRVAALFGKSQTKSVPGTLGEGGNGLGLMFSADLARALEGLLEVESAEGKGSTFRLRLPDVVDGEL